MSGLSDQEQTDFLCRIAKRYNAVIPAAANKHPFAKWSEIEKTPPDMIMGWITQFDPALWAIITGRENGLMVIDFDVKDGGMEVFGELGIEPHIVTPSGGAHLYFTPPDYPISSSARKCPGYLGKGVDIRSEKGIIMFHGKTDVGEYKMVRNVLAPYDLSILTAGQQEKLGVSESIGKVLYLSMFDLNNDSTVPEKSKNNIDDEILEEFLAEQVEHPPLPVAALPAELHTLVTGFAVPLGADCASVLTMLLPTLAAAIGGQRSIRLNNSWVAPSILWSLLILPSGDRKSVILQQLNAPLVEADRKACQEYQKAMKRYRRDQQQYEAELKKASRKKEEGATVPQEPVKPIQKRYLLNDITAEALAEVLGQNPGRGILLVHDEASGFVNGMDQYRAGKGKDTESYLSLYDGGRWIVDRKQNQEPLIVEEPRLSIVGGIQPSMFKEMATQENISRGLMPRLMVCQPAHSKRIWSNDGIDDHVRQGYEELVAGLLELPVVEDGDLPLSAEAEKVYVGFYTENAHMMESASDTERSIRSKFENTVAKLALIFQVVADRSATAIDEDAMSKAIEIGGWYLAEALRIYGLQEQSIQAKKAVSLYRFIAGRGSSVTLRDICRYGPHGLRRAESARACLGELMKFGFVQQSDEFYTVVSPSARD